MISLGVRSLLLPRGLSGFIIASTATKRIRINSKSMVLLDDPIPRTMQTTSSENNLEPLVICGPSGVGKGSLIERLMQRYPDTFGFSVSHTTRSPRPGEVHGQHYFFSTLEEMQQEIEDGQFVEHANVHGNLYGTSKKAIERLQLENKITILDIDRQGVMTVKESGLLAKFIFIAPPSLSILEERLRGRATETEEAIQRRMGNAVQEILYGETPGTFDRIIVNDDLEEATQTLIDVLCEWYPQLKT
ncbi:guanylate kinase [Nitzschia inconspicua]|uniref:guanylate kinase n=1 Tax=Nitzschia inconspicua TaxID=303405 RepID=A0A9K3KFQ6_9STRA|nr:guanylate kinase [Nitzschia inconspicua]